jgi:hypothetical protein
LSNFLILSIPEIPKFHINMVFFGLYLRDESSNLLLGARPDISNLSLTQF